MAEEKKKILAVDDVGMNLMIVKDILSPYFDVRVAKTGEIALNILKKLPIALALLDIELPGMSGLELLAIIRDMPDLSQIPVICVTSHGDEATFASALQAGAKDVIVKPVDPALLQKKVFDELGIESAD